MSTLNSHPPYLSSLAFYVAQLYRFLPFNSHPALVRNLQPWCRVRLRSRNRPFKAGLGYWLTETTDNLYYISGLYEVQYLEMIHRRLHKGSLLIDIGANVGTSVLWLHFAKPRKVFSFLAVEALPDTAAILRMNRSLNPEVVCGVVEVALSNFTGEIEFGTAGAGDGSARNVAAISETELARRTKIRVKTAKLDAIVLPEGKKPAFLLIDVEGFARPVLEGGIATIIAHRPEIGLEIHSLDELTGCEEILFSHGYRVAWEGFRDGHHRIYSCT